MPISHYTSNVTNQNLNLLVSNDGRNWTTVNHMPADTRGWKAIHCYFDGYLWGWSQTSAGAFRLYKIPPISARTVDAIRVDYPITNQLAAREDSTFTTSGDAADLGNWTNQGAGWGYSTTEAVAGGSDDSGHVWHGQTHPTDKDNITVVTAINEMATAIASGDYYALAYDVWATGYDEAYEGLNVSGPATNITHGSTTAFRPGTKRLRAILNGKCTGAVTGTEAWKLNTNTATDGEATSWDLYIDSVALYTSTTQWPTWAAFQPAGTARTAEVVTIPLGGLGANWSIAFDFQAGNSLELIGDHAICCLHGAGGDYVDLEFVGASEKYRITDQGATAATLGTAARRLWNDQVRVVITCDGTDTELHVYDAMSGEQTIGDGLGVLMANGAPARLVLGSNNDETVRGQGLFWGFKRWNKTLSSAEITAHWSVAGEGVVTRTIGK